MSLTPDQIRAIKLSNSGLTDSEIAAAVGISVRTLQRWKKNSEFVSAVGQVEAKTTQIIIEQCADTRADLSSQAYDRTASLVPKAFDLLESIMNDPEVKTSDKLKSIALLLNRLPNLPNPPVLDEVDAINRWVSADLLPIEVLEKIADSNKTFRQSLRQAILSGGQSEAVGEVRKV